MGKWLILLVLGVIAAGRAEEMEIASITQYEAKGQDGRAHNYIKISWIRAREAIGYKIFVSQSDSSGAREEMVGAMNSADCFQQSCQKTGLLLKGMGTKFLKVCAVTPAGKDGLCSNKEPVVYAGVDG